MLNVDDCTHNTEVVVVATGLYSRQSIDMAVTMYVCIAGEIFANLIVQVQRHIYSYHNYHLYRYTKIMSTYIYIYIYNIYRVFSGNYGKVKYYISGSITHKFLNFLYLYNHSWRYITTNF